MQTRRLGRTGPNVSSLALGCMGMSDFYGPANEGESIATIHAALDAGITLLDTGDFYAMGHNEMLIATALQGVPRDKYLLSVKFGAQRGPDGAFIGFDTRPSAVKTAVAYSLQRLKVDYIDVYRPARVDPNVPIEDTVGAIADLIKAGYVRHLALSEAGADTIRRAHAVQPVVDLQIEYSLMSRGVEREILPVLRELGIAVTAYGVLSRGLLSADAAQKATGHRAHYPRFQGENFKHNLGLVAQLETIAKEKGATIPQIALAWVMSRGDDIVPLLGSRKRTQLQDLLAAEQRVLTPADLERIEAAVPAEAVLGTRYAAAQMPMLDSERPRAT